MAEAEDEMTLENLTSGLRKTLECQLCLDVVKQPFKLCARGHLMCVGCLNTMTSCPTCEGVLTSKDPVCIKQLLDYLPRDCRYSTNGCKKLVQGSNNHEKFCGFRDIECGFLTCGSILAKDLSNHYKANHIDDAIVTNEQKGLRLPGPTFNWSFRILLFNNFFWLSFDSENVDNYFMVTFEVVPVGKLDSNYYATLSFAKGDFRLMFTLAAFSVEHNNEFSYEMAENDPEDCSCMKVPKSIFSHFINEDASVSFDLVVFRGKNESIS